MPFCNFEMRDLGGTYGFAVGVIGVAIGAAVGVGVGAALNDNLGFRIKDTFFTTLRFLAIKDDILSY